MAWETHFVRMPRNAGTGKAVAVGDLNGDRRPDLVLSCENARGEKSGVVLLIYCGTPRDRVWYRNEISGPEGVKYDMVQLHDLDADGDLDVLTCEEARNLGVIWYENPARRGTANDE